MTVTTLLAQGAPSGEQACATAATATPAGAAATMPDASWTPKAPTPCEGFGWEKSEPTLPWQHWYGTYVFFVEGAPKASSKFTIERVGGTFKAKSTDCTGTGLKGWQHKVVCCKPCHTVRCDGERTAKVSVQAMDKCVTAGELMGQSKLSKADVAFLHHSIVERPPGIL